jgi:methylmalonyl-CoA mutase N-terminal domain/subunit
MVEAIENGYPQREIAHSAYVYQQAVERREKIVVGVNEFASDGAAGIPSTLYIDETAGERQCARLAAVRARRNQAQVSRALEALVRAAGTGENLMPLLLDAVRAYATLGEMCAALRRVWGEYVEEPTI